MLEIVQHIVTGFFIGYLSFTNSLALYVESLIPALDTEARRGVPTEPSEHALTDITSATRSLGDSFPKILLEHEEYQRAAVIASRSSSESPVDIGDTPLADAVKDALVNVYCQYTTAEYVKTTTGTGFFINPKGVILTNAHVAQFLLLRNTDVVGDVSCVIRSGDPATPRYHAELLYISPRWVFENSNVITEESPRGTGERDYALLYVSKSVENDPLPSRFPAIPVDVALLSRSVEHDEVVTAGYPAEELMRRGPDAALTPVVASTSVGMLYTFGSNYADLFSISESPVGEHGASGGPIVSNETRGTIGLIVTKGDPETEGERSLRALTLSYVDRTITEETGFSLAENMQGDIALRGNVFKKAMAPFLSDILEDALRGN